MDLNVINDSNILDDEFKRYLDVAKGLMRKMRLAEDKRVSAKYIRECIKMTTHNATIKANRNKFFQYLLKAMNRAVEDEKIFINFNDQVMDNSNQEMKQWSADRKSYVAAKVIPGFGALIYMASTDQPDLGWEENGFGKLDKVYNLPDDSAYYPRYEHTLLTPLDPLPTVIEPEVAKTPINYDDPEPEPVVVLPSDGTVPTVVPTSNGAAPASDATVTPPAGTPKPAPATRSSK